MKNLTTALVILGTFVSTGTLQVSARGVSMFPSSVSLASSGQAESQTKSSEQTKTAHPAPKPSAIESVRRYLQKLGEPIDTAKSTADMVVSSYTDAKNEKVTIVIVHDKKKDLLGLYVYNFGNLKSAPDADAVERYLLAANDAITIGAFFVDNDKDIGYKYFMNTSQLSLPTFESIYLTVAMVAADRRPEIRRLLSQKTNTGDKQPQSDH